MADIKYEREGDAPADWKTDTILQRNCLREVCEIDVPDDDVHGDFADSQNRQNQSAQQTVNPSDLRLPEEVTKDAVDD